jgi:hypothetical protein
MPRFRKGATPIFKKGHNETFGALLTKRPTYSEADDADPGVGFAVSIRSSRSLRSGNIWLAVGLPSLQVMNCQARSRREVRFAPETKHACAFISPCPRQRKRRTLERSGDHSPAPRPGKTAAAGASAWRRPIIYVGRDAGPTAPGTGFNRCVGKPETSQRSTKAMGKIYYCCAASLNGPGRELIRRPMASVRHASGRFAPRYRAGRRVLGLLLVPGPLSAIYATPLPPLVECSI